MIGLKYDRITVLEQVSKFKYLCLCSCGNTLVLYRSSILRKHYKSCGCLYKDSRHYIKTKFTHHITSFDSVVNRKLRQYINDSKKKNHEWNLSKEDFLALILENCYYCGSEPNQIKIIKRQCEERVTYYLNGIDRIDSSLGYTINNTVPSCYVCNRAKSDMPKFEFLKWVKRIYRHHQKLSSTVLYI